MSVNNFVIQGHICFSETMDHIHIVENGYLLVEDGVCCGVFEKLPERYANLPRHAYGDSLVIPGMTDLHLHAPQFAFRAVGLDMELLEWLNTYTFPEEAKYADLAYAEKAYEIFVRHMLKSTTTRAAMFGTIHVPATMRLMQMLDASGLCTYVGKVNMNRHSPYFLQELSTRDALRDTEQWIEQCADFRHTKPIITPRFIPSCTDDLMFGLSNLRRKYHLPSQSHLSENLSEIAWVKELCPAAKGYGDAYERFGLFGGDHKCIMAHCVHSDEREQERMKENGVFVAHSPESNSNLASGIAPVNQFLERGLNVGLATDIAGGTHESMLRAMVQAIQASKLRWRLVDQSIAPLSFERAFYLATMGSGAFFGKVGTFKDGYAADVVVIDDTTLEHPQELTVRARLERMIYLADDRNITAKFVEGRKVL